MSSFYQITFSVVAVLSILSALLEFKATISYDRARSYFRNSENVPNNAVRRQSELTFAKQAQESMASAAETEILLARVYRSLAKGNEISSASIQYYCKALSHVGAALAHQPTKGRYLVAWASLRQLLGGARCDESNTSGDYIEAIKFALNGDPVDLDVTFASAQLYLWSGNKSMAYSLFKKVLTYNTSTTIDQKRFIFSQISNAEDLTAIIPARFPQVNEWARFFREWDPGAFVEFREALSTLQIEALESSLMYVDTNEVEPEVRWLWLTELANFSASDDVRKRVDNEMVHYQETIGNTKLADLLSRRAALNEQKIVRAYEHGDTRATTSPLVHWNMNEIVNLDDYYPSLGFYMVGNAQATLIELQSEQEVPALNPNLIKILVSDDNQNWSELRYLNDPEVLIVGSGSLVQLYPERQQHKYWKVHISGALRMRSFVNKLEYMLRVYG